MPPNNFNDFNINSMKFNWQANDLILTTVSQEKKNVNLLSSMNIEQLWLRRDISVSGRPNRTVLY